MLKDLRQKVADFIQAERFFSAGDKVLIAVSGGADSTALLHIMAGLVTDGVLPVEVCCAHINHQLRGDDAQRDEDFVVEQCRRLDLPLIKERIDVRGYAGREKLSIESAARKLRIDCLLEIAGRQDCSCIATAHQKNDNAETILHRLIRGTGFRGLGGIWPVKEFTGGIRFVRPLLCVSRAEILEYLNERKLEWCEDRTNLDCSYRRNFIRNRLLPALQQDCTDNIVERLDELAKTARRFHSLICETADAIWSDVVTAQEGNMTLDVDSISSQPPEVKVEIIRRALADLDSGEQDVTQRHYNDILRLSQGETVAKLQLPNNIEVRRQGSQIVFVHSRKSETIKTTAAEPVILKVPGDAKYSDVLIRAETLEYDAVSFKKFRMDKSSDVEWFDLDKVQLPLCVRGRQNGDRFVPLGMAGGKKLGKFLTAEHVLQKVRQNVIVVADAEKIIWLCPVRISERTKVTEDTKRVLQISIGRDG